MVDREPKYVQPVGMQGNAGEVLEVGEVEGTMAVVDSIDGVELRDRKRVKARLVFTSDGRLEAVGGGEGEPITVLEAGRVLDETVVGLVTNALARARRRRKKARRGK